MCWTHIVHKFICAKVEVLWFLVASMNVHSQTADQERLAMSTIQIKGYVYILQWRQKQKKLFQSQKGKLSERKVR